MPSKRNGIGPPRHRQCRGVAWASPWLCFHGGQAHLSEHDTLILLLEPLDGVFFLNLVFDADFTLASFAARDTEPRTLQADIKVHAVDSGRRIVLDTKVDVLGDTESKVARDRKVLAIKLVLLDLQTTLKNFHCFLAANLSERAQS